MCASVTPSKCPRHISCHRIRQLASHTIRSKRLSSPSARRLVACTHDSRLSSLTICPVLRARPLYCSCRVRLGCPAFGSSPSLCPHRLVSSPTKSLVNIPFSVASLELCLQPQLEPSHLSWARQCPIAENLMLMAATCRNCHLQQYVHCQKIVRVRSMSRVAPSMLQAIQGTILKF